MASSAAKARVNPEYVSKLGCIGCCSLVVYNPLLFSIAIHITLQELKNSKLWPILICFNGITTLNPRKLAKAICQRVDVEKIKKDGELLPGGDIRILGNQWIRSAYERSGLSRIPREASMRLCIHKVVRKARLRFRLSDIVFQPDIDDDLSPISYLTCFDLRFWKN